MPLWLVGMMGSGKTTVGQLVAGRRGTAFLDTDEMVVAATGRSVADIWADEGPASFRLHEKRAVAEAGRREAVVATGGGAVLDDDNVVAMRSTGYVVWLDARPQVLASRVAEAPLRPLLTGRADPEAALALIAEQRRSQYERAAHLRIEVEEIAAEEVADRVEAAWTGS